MKYLNLLFLVSLLILSTTSCSNDDAPEIPAAEFAAGTYTCTGSGQSLIINMDLSNEQNVKIAAVSDSRASVEYSIDYNGMNFGTFKTDNATVTVDKKDGTASINGSGTISMGMGNKPAEYDFTVSGKISKDKKDVEFIFNVPDVMGGLTITLN